MMLTSTLRSLAAGTAILALSAWGISALVQNDSTYTPRPEASVAQPDGAMDIRRMLVGDADGNIDQEGLQVLRRQVVKAAKSSLSRRPAACRCTNSVPTTSVVARVALQRLVAARRRVRRFVEVQQPRRQLEPGVPQLDGGFAIAGDGTTWARGQLDGAGGEGGSGFRGDSIWMSTDNGASWSLVDGTDGYDATDAPSPIPTTTGWYASMDGWRHHQRRVGGSAGRLKQPQQRHRRGHCS